MNEGDDTTLSDQPNQPVAGVEAVVDKDYAAVVLAEAAGADALLLLTDVDAVYWAWDAPERSRIRRLTPEAAGAWARDGTVAPL